MVDLPRLVADRRRRSPVRVTTSWNTMKSATRISSIAPPGLEQCSRARRFATRCGADSLATTGSCAGCTCSPGVLEHSRHGVLGEPLDLEVGMEPRGARRRSPGPVGRGRARSATRRKGPRRVRFRLRAHRPRPGRPLIRRSTKSRIRRLTRTRSRTSGRWPAPSSTTSSPRVAGPGPQPGPAGLSRSSSPAMTRVGDDTRPAHPCTVSASRADWTSVSNTSGVVSAAQLRQSSKGLVEWGSGRH